MAQANPAAADAGTELKVAIDGMKQRTGVTCEVVGISTCDNVRVIFLGTAHVSKESPKDVKKLLEDYVRSSGRVPLAIAVELCKQRQHLYSSNQPVAAVDPNTYAVVEIRKLIDQQISRGVAPSVAVVTSILSYFYSWTSSKVGSGVGEEFVAAYRTAEALVAQGFSTDRDFWCCDRLVNVTLQRLMRKLSLWELYKLAFSLVAGVLMIDEDDLKLIEQMRMSGGDMLTVAMRQFAAEYPMAANVLIDERNEWMASYIWLQCDQRAARTACDTVFVVAGAAHLPGLIDAAVQLWPKSQQDKCSKKHEMEQRMKELEIVPKHSNVPTFMRTLPFALLACSGGLYMGLRSVRSHWTNHGPSKTLAAACIAYAGWRGFKYLRKRSDSEFLQRIEPLLSLAGASAAPPAHVIIDALPAVTYGIVKGAAALARKILANRV